MGGCEKTQNGKSYLMFLAIRLWNGTERQNSIFYFCCRFSTMFAFLLLLTTATALPQLFNESTICNTGSCIKDDLKYELILPAQPGYQWDDAGGYCGSWAIQRAALTKGAWISQQQVRDHTVPGGGHDNEILSTNIMTAFQRLHIDVNAFDYTQPTPQQNAYGKWIKQQLVQGYAVTWMILWSGQSYPIYGLKAPAGMYGHVEPVIGIQSNHPLNDTTVYDDDVVVHFTDGGVNKVYRKISSLGGNLWGECFHNFFFVSLLGGIVCSSFS